MQLSYPTSGLARLPPPMTAKPVTALPCGEDWLYEFLWGGERVRAVKHAAGVHLFSRDGDNLANRFPRVAAAVAKLRAAQAVLDGEILMLDSFSAAALGYLEHVSDDITQARVAFLVYDLLAEGAEDLRPLSLLCRRVKLASMVQGTPLILSPLSKGPPEARLAQAAQLGLSGVVAKRGGSPYRPNALRSDWLKVTLDRAPHAGRGGRSARIVGFRAPSALAGGA